MKRFAFLLVISLAGTSTLAAQGPGRAGLSQVTVAPKFDKRDSAPVVASGGMTRSEKGALIGAIAGVIAGAAISIGYDEKKFSDVVVAGIVMAIPVSLIGALIAMLTD